MNYREPDSVIVLLTKNEKEKKYLQRTIIQMELKQFSESIAMITFRKKLKKRAEHDPSNIKNRPLLWIERLEEEYHYKKQPAKATQNI